MTALLWALAVVAVILGLAACALMVFVTRFIWRVYRDVMAGRAEFERRRGQIDARRARIRAGLWADRPHRRHG